MSDRFLKIELEKLLGGVAVPDKLVQSASSIKNLSVSLIPLKGNEESARNTVCAELAIEQHPKEFRSTQKHIAPVPPRVYQALKRRFVRTLPGLGASTEELKRTRSDYSGTPADTPVDRLKSVDSVAAVAAGPSTEHTQPKRRKRGGAGPNDPTVDSIAYICQQLDVYSQLQSSITFAYRQYNNLVKDRWGFTCGLVIVIIQRAQPSKDLQKVRSFLLSFVPRMTLERLDEWTDLVEKIISDRSWVRKLALENGQPAVSRASSLNQGEVSVGSMITRVFAFNEPSRVQNFETWMNKMRLKVGLPEGDRKVSDVDPAITITQEQ